MSRWWGTAPIESDRRFCFDSPREELWAQLADVGGYRARWPWLHEFDGTALVAGQEWRCRVRPQFPYSVRFTVRIDEVVPVVAVAATITGDIGGTANLAIVEGASGGCEIHLVSSLVPLRVALRGLAVVGRPVIRRGHDWILATGARQLARPDCRVQGTGSCGR